MEGQDAIEAPIDGLLLSKKGGDNQAARDFLAYRSAPPKDRMSTPRSTRPTSPPPRAPTPRSSRR